MAIVPIKSRPDKHILMDDEVADIIGHWGWCLDNKGYATAHLPGSGRENRKNVFCSRAVVWANTGEWPQKGIDTDHINHNTLDNRLENIRQVTHQINHRNRIKHKKTTSKYLRVRSRNKDTWCSQVTLTLKGKKYYISGKYTKDEDIAGLVGDCIVHKIGGYLQFNFPNLTFKQKWERIGEPQRNQIDASLKKYGIYTQGVV